MTLIVTYFCSRTYFCRLVGNTVGLGFIPAVFFLMFAILATVDSWRDDRCLPTFGEIRQWLTPSVAVVTMIAFTAYSKSCSKYLPSVVGYTNTALTFAQLPLGIFLYHQATRFRRLVLWLCLAQGSFAVAAWIVSGLADYLYRYG